MYTISTIAITITNIIFINGIMAAFVSRMPSVNTHKIALTAILSKLAYQSPEEIQQLWDLLHHHSPIIPPIDVTEDTLLHEFMRKTLSKPIFLQASCDCEDTQLFIFIQRKSIYICFRGSSSFKDFAANIDVQRYCLSNTCSVPVPPKVTIHKGFFEQYRAIEHYLYDILYPYFPTHMRIILCGHSLGAALAQIAASHIASHPSFHSAFEISCYTFGGPRVGNYAFVNWFQSSVAENYRIVHRSDPIPNVPILPFWRHTTGLCLVFDKNNVYIEAKDKRWYQRFFWFLKTCIPWSVLNFNDHAMSVYVRDWLQFYTTHPTINSPTESMTDS